MSSQDEKGIGWTAGEVAQHDKEFTSKRFFGSEEILMNRGEEAYGYTSCMALCMYHIVKYNGLLGDNIYLDGWLFCY